MEGLGRQRPGRAVLRRLRRPARLHRRAAGCRAALRPLVDSRAGLEAGVARAGQPAAVPAGRRLRHPACARSEPGDEVGARPANGPRTDGGPEAAVDGRPCAPRRRSREGGAVSLSTQLRRYARPLAALLAMMVVAVGVALYVLSHQRLRFPWESVYHVNAEFTSAQAVTPGQGQNVTVAGVTVGEISSVHLHDGRAVVGMEIDPDKLPAVYDNAQMLLRPKTGLTDMSIALDPGDPPGRHLRDGGTLGAAHTEPNVNPDEVLAALDGDTRSYLSILVNEGGRGLAGRGVELRDVLKASEPTLARTKRITAALADR